MMLLLCIKKNKNQCLIYQCLVMDHHHHHQMLNEMAEKCMHTEGEKQTLFGTNFLFLHIDNDHAIFFSHMSCVCMCVYVHNEVRKKN